MEPLIVGSPKRGQPLKKGQVAFPCASTFVSCHLRDREEDNLSPDSITWHMALHKIDQNQDVNIPQEILVN